MKSQPAESPLTGAPARVARVLLENGPLTATGVCEVLGLTGTAVRRHLDTLVSAGYAETNDSPPFGPKRARGRGRPARIYTLTDAGRSAFSEAYDDLAIAALRHLSAQLGSAAITTFARQRAAEMAERYRPSLDGESDLAERAKALAKALGEDGFVTTTEANGSFGLQLCQHNCPIAHVAAEFPEFCDAETEAFSELIGTHVTRLAALSHGDGICTTHIPLRSDAATTRASTSTERSSA